MILDEQGKESQVACFSNARLQVGGGIKVPQLTKFVKLGHEGSIMDLLKLADLPSGKDVGAD
jgi:hypothetical protein